MKLNSERFLNFFKSRTGWLVGETKIITVYKSFLSLILLFYIYFTTSSLPFQDEIDDYLHFVIRVSDDGIGPLFEAYRASFRTIHNLFLYKLIYYTQFQLVGHLDFRLLPILGNLAFCFAIIKLTGRNFFKLPLRWSIIPTLVFFIPLYQVHNWGMVASGSLLRLLLVLLGAGFLFDRSRLSFWGLAFVFFLSIQSGTGVLVYVALTISGVLFFRSVSRDKGGLLVLGAVFALLVFSWRTIEGSPPEISSYYLYFRGIAEYILATLGSSFQYIFTLNEKYWCVWIGLVILLLLVWQLYLNRALVLKDPMIVTILIYLLIVPALGSTQRWYFTFHHALSARFVIYSLLILGILGFLVSRSLLTLRSKWLAIGFQFCILLFFTGFTLLNVIKMNYHRLMLEEGFTHLQVNHQIEKIYMDKPHGDRFRDILLRAIDKKIFPEPGVPCSRVTQGILRDSAFRRMDVSHLQFDAQLEGSILYLHFSQSDYIKEGDIKILVRKVFSQEVFEIQPKHYDGKFYAMVDFKQFPADIGEYSLYIYLQDPQQGAYMGDLDTRISDLISSSN